MNKATIFKGIVELRPRFHTILSFSSSSVTQQWSPNVASFCITALQVYAQERNLTKGKELHSYILRNGLANSSPVFSTSLINMYSKCNNVSAALSVFDTSIQCRNVFVYNAIIAGLVSNELPRNAVEIYNSMQPLDGIMPDKFTFPCVIKALSDVSEVIDIRKIHGLIFKLGLEFDVYIGSALSHCFLKLGLVESADKVFVEMPTRDVVLWNAMINGYAQIGQPDRALLVFGLMIEERFVPSRFTVTGILSAFAATGDLRNGMAIHGFVNKMGYDSGLAVSNAFVDFYGKCKRLDDAQTVFNDIPDKDIFSWNSIMCVHGHCGDHDETLRLFDMMLRDGVKPDIVTITTVLPACAHLATINRGKEIHAYMIVNGLDEGDTNVKNAVIDMYAKCGSMREARLVFDETSRKDVASWNIVIMGYGIHGLGNEAIEMFSAMCEHTRLDPDEITFVGILSACVHAGFVSHGRGFFAEMQTKYGIVPTVEHYTCMVDLLGRAGELREAYELISNIQPEELNSVVWRAFLSACRLHGNADFAEIATGRIRELDPYHCGSYVLMSNIYGAVGRYEEVSNVRRSMKGENVRKTPGCSWIELGNGFACVFTTGDRTHP